MTRNPGSALAVLVLSLASVSFSGAQQEWRLGGRLVPGPLPPDPAAALPALEVWKDVIYGYADGRALKLDFARPAVCAGQTIPLAVFVHGGGWHSGDKDGAFNTSYARMFFQLGFAVASVNYRLSPEFQFPAHIHDCKLAVRHLRFHASQFGIDPDRIGLWGSSAGGHLVSLMAAADDDDGLEGPGLAGTSSRPQAVVDHFGPTDLTVFLDLAPGQAATLAGFLGCLPADCPETARRASPAAYVTADDPPVLIIHGDQDPVVPYHQAEIFAEALRTAGNAGALIKVLNAGHGFTPVPAGAQIAPTRNEISFLTVAHLARFIEPALFGDLDMDGDRDLFDLVALVALLGSQGFGPGAAPAPPRWNPLADLVPDGRVDGLDLEAFWRIR
ncbi:MAG: hypothetical protein FJY83_00110 [Candidatus Aminicenantes bacterium]|nr:hypothetical protein [Candidatus Aminicenantes bacterium]